MKRILVPLTTVIVALIASACSGAVPTPSSEQIMSDVYTAVAMTVTTGASPDIPTLAATSTPYPTFTPFSIPTLAATPTATTGSNYTSASNCNDSAYVKDMTIPDGTVLTPGEEFVKTWKFENTGSCTWSTDYQITFVSGYKMDGSATDIDQTVSSGKKAEISVSLTAPDTTGTYYGYWQLENEYGYTFGDEVYVEIVVSEATATPTATNTLTPTTTSTPVTSTATTTEGSTAIVEPTATSTLGQTSTTAPTATLSPTPIPANTDVPTPTNIPAATPTDDPSETPSS